MEKQIVKNSAVRFFRVLLLYFKKVVGRIANLAEDTDVEGTINGIKSGIVLEGPNLWILICSTIIACIGLDTNSPAVIIGAMLISPLMSPILGIGLSVGINDREALIKSSRNFGVAMFLSLLVSFLYFHITPFGTLTDEMRARTTPTLLDAFVAFFGGLAGIIAGSRTSKTNAIPGVAIATALMPPLCTSGYGLASGRIEVFASAFYLFFINAVLISISTYIIVRLLKFPRVNMLDPKVEAKAKRMVYFFLLLLMVPSMVFLFNSLKTLAETNIINSFISRHIHEDVESGAQWTYKSDNDSLSTLRVYYFGRYIRPDSISILEGKFKEQFHGNYLLRFTAPTAMHIELTPTDAPPDEEKKRMNQEITQIKSKLVTMQQIQASEVEGRQHEVDSLQVAMTKAIGDTIPFYEIKSELSALFPELQTMSLSKATQTSFDSLGEKTVYTALVKWDRTVYRSRDKRDKESRIRQYLAVKMRDPEVQVISY